MKIEGEVIMMSKKKKKSLPPNVTTPRRGPLKLTSPKAAQLQHTPKEDKRHYVRFSAERRPQARQGYLTRYPVHKVPPKPMDVIEGHLVEGGLTWTELGHNLQLLQVSQQRNCLLWRGERKQLPTTALLFMSACMCSSDLMVFM